MNRFPALVAAMTCGALALASCGRDDADVIRVVPEGDTRVALAAIDLSGHAGFDQLDRFVQSTGAAGDAMQVYEDLSRLAPDNPLVLVRAAHAALVLDGSDDGIRMAGGILERLAPREGGAPADPDVLYLDLLLTTRMLARGGTGNSLALNAGTAPAARRALTRLAPLADAADWVGPHGVRTADATRTLDAIRDALQAFDGATASPAPSAPTDGGATP